MNRSCRYSIFALLVVMGIMASCGSPTVEPTPAALPGGGPFGLVDGPYASVDAVPVSESPAFQPIAPERLVLTNGLNVLLQHDPALPIVDVRIFLDAGTWDDPRGRTGVAEMAARVMREGGGETWPAAQLDEELAFLGASLELDAEETRMVARVRCLEEDFNRVLGMLEDMIRAPTFPEEVIEKVRARMHAELAQRDDSSGRQADREARRAFYGVDDPRVRRVEASDLDAITRDDLVNFHRRHVGSRRALIAMLGSISVDDARIELDRRFGDWAGQIADARETLPAPTGVDARTIFLLERGDVNQAEIRILHPGVEMTDPDRPALLLGSYVLGSGGFGSRMMQRIRVQLGLAYSAGASWRMRPGRDGLFRAATATRSATFGVALEEVLGVLESFQTVGLSDSEFASARDRWLHSQVFRVDTPAEVLWRIAELEMNSLTWDFDEVTVEAVRALTAEQVLAACTRHLDPSQLLIFVVGDPQSFDRPVADFGAAADWKLQAEADAEAAGSSAAFQLAERVLAHHGGAEVWSSVGAVSVEANLGQSPMSILMVYPDRMSWRPMDAELPSMVLVGNRLWTGEGEMLSEERGIAGAAICQAELPILLMRLARGELTLTSPAEGVLVATDPSGHETRIDIGPDGLIRHVATATQKQLFSSYSLQAGVMLPGLLEQTDAGQEPFTTELRGWTMAPEYSAVQFEGPEQ